MLRAFTDFDGLHLVDFSARAQVVLSESAASTNSATRATRAYAVAVPGHGGRDYRGSFAERVWARAKIAFSDDLRLIFPFRSHATAKCMNRKKILWLRRRLLVLRPLRADFPDGSPRQFFAVAVGSVVAPVRTLLVPAAWFWTCVCYGERPQYIASVTSVRVTV